MKKRLKSLLRTVLVAGAMTLMMTSTALAGQWKQDNVGWWYQNDDGSYPANEWLLDNGKWYFFDNTGYMVANRWEGNYYLGADGAMLVNTTTPDGYVVGADGAWIPNTEPQTATQQIVTPKISTLMPSTTDVNAWFALISIDNNGDSDLTIYSKNSKMLDGNYSSYNRNTSIVKLVNDNLISVDKVEIKPNKSETIIFALESSSWYDKNSSLLFGMEYKEQGFVCIARGESHLCQSLSEFDPSGTITLDFFR